MRRILVCLGAMLGLVTIAAPTVGDDWPQWMGPQRDSVWRESDIVDRFPSDGLPVKWRTPVAGGYAGPAVANGRVFLTDYVRTEGEIANSAGGVNELKGRERVLCLDAESGEVRWIHEYDRPYRLSYAAGPRATPTVDGGRVYTLGAHGDLRCLEVDSGRPVWKKDLESAYGVKTPIWGFSGHPLIDGDQLICLVGGPGSVVVSFDKHTGRENWRALSASEPGYCPPTMIEAGGERQLLIWHADSINALDPATGKVYWSQSCKPAYGMAIAAPRKAEDLLYVSGHGKVAALFRLGKSSPTADVVWRGNTRRGIFCSNSTPIIDGGVLYGVGSDGGELAAMNLLSGERLWETFAPNSGTRRASHGTVFLVKHEDRFFLFNERGELILARLTAAGYEEIDRFHVLAPTNEAFGRPVVWSHPAFAKRCLFARNDQEIVCVSLAR